MWMVKESNFPNVVHYIISSRHATTRLPVFPDCQIVCGPLILRIRTLR